MLAESRPLCFLLLCWFFFFLRKVHGLGHPEIIWEVGHDLYIVTYPEVVQNQAIWASSKEKVKV